MKSSPSAFFLVVILPLALAAAAVACGGGGPSSLEDYFERLDEIRDDVSERSDTLNRDFGDELDAAATDDEELQTIQGFYSEFASLMIGAVDDLGALGPPQEAESLHGDFVDVQSDGLALLSDLVEELNDAESPSDAEERFDEMFVDALGEISRREDEACFALQRLADDKDIGVDLDCGDGGDLSADDRATASPTPRDVEVVSYRSHRTEYSLQFFGEVVNNGDGAAANVQVALTLTDDAGRIVGAGLALVEGRAILEPGTTAPFSMLIDDPLAEWTNEAFQVSAEEPGGFTFGDTYAELEVSGVTVVPSEAGGLTIRGTIANVGSRDATLVEVAFVARDAAGTVLWVEDTYLDIDPLPPAVDSPFEIRSLDFDEIPPAFDVLASGAAP
jgi:hypothetical protein